MNRIDTALQQQIDSNKTKNLLYARLGQIIEINPDFLAALEELLAGDEKALSEATSQATISSASRLLLKRLYSINQFLQIDAHEVHLLGTIYRHTWQKIVETKNIQATLRDDHYPELTNWIARLYPPSFLSLSESSPTIGHVICEEYSPQLQLDLLKLDSHTLRQPMLDLGCGSTASLVRHLRALRIEAYGVDRLIEQAEPYLCQTDWLAYELAPETWGTITSNMAFTNHLLYAYHHDRAQFVLYVRKFNELLESLLAGGSFHYAPSVPIIEQRLDTKTYRMEHSDVVENIGMTRIIKMRNHVERIDP